MMAGADHPEADSASLAASGFGVAPPLMQLAGDADDIPTSCVACTASIIGGETGGEAVDPLARRSSEHDPDRCEECVQVASLIAASSASVWSPPAPQPGTMAWQRLVCHFIRLAKATGGSEIPISRLAGAWAAGEARVHLVAQAEVQSSRQADGAPQARLPQSMVVKGEVRSIASASRPTRTLKKVASRPESIAARAASSHSSGRRGRAMQPSASSGASQLQEVADTHAGLGSHDFATPGDLLGDLPINSYSIDEGLPATNLGYSIGRIRGTTNSRTLALCDDKWAGGFSVTAVTSLLDRLKNNAKNIVGKPNVDLEIGYNQMVSRVGNLLQVWMVVKSWSDYRRDASLVAIIGPMCALEPFFQAVSATLGAELRLMLAYAAFQKKLAESGRIDLALALIDFSEVAEAQAKWLACPEPPAIVAEEEAAEEEEEDQPPPPQFHGRAKGQAKGQAKKKASARVAKAQLQVSAYLRLRFDPPALTQLARIVCEALAATLYDTTSDLDDVVVQNLIEELDGLYRVWVAKAGDSAESLKFASFVQDFGYIVKCMNLVESERPPVESVRQAMKNLYDLQREALPQTQLAKALSAHKNGKTLIAAAVSHSRTGLEDSAASQAFDSAVLGFETKLEVAFDMGGEFLLTGNQGKRQTIDSFASFCAAVPTMGSATVGAVGRWSAAAVADKREQLSNTLGNCVVVLLMSFEVLLFRCDDFLRNAIPESAALVALRAESHRNAPLNMTPAWHNSPATWHHLLRRRLSSRPPKRPASPTTCSKWRTRSKGVGALHGGGPALRRRLQGRHRGHPQLLPLALPAPPWLRGHRRRRGSCHSDGVVGEVCGELSGDGEAHPVLRLLLQVGARGPPVAARRSLAHRALVAAVHLLQDPP